MPITTLRSAPFLLDDSDSVIARVTVINAIGESPTSITGNGALIPLTLSPAGAPTNLIRTDNFLVKTEIQMSWQAPTDTGNTQILDYRLEYAVNAGSF